MRENGEGTEKARKTIIAGTNVTPNEGEVERRLGEAT